MRLGDYVEAAIWLDGRESAVDRARFEQDIARAMTEGQAMHGVILGPVVYIEKKPGAERVPPVPAHIAGPNVRMLVAEARIVGLKPVVRGRVGFVDDLTLDDRQLLRRKTREAYERDYPGLARLSDRQCDTLINDAGPKAALDTLDSLKPGELH